MDTADIKIGALIYVKHGIGKQIARVEGFTKGCRIKVRAYNASRGKWMNNLRPILPIDVRGNSDKQTTDFAPLPALSGEA